MFRIKVVTFLVVPLLLASCIDTSAPIESRFGRYTLQRINGEALPQQVIENTAVRLEFLRGVVRLNSNGTFTDSTELRVTTLGPNSSVRVSTDVAAGTYRIAGDSVLYSSTRGENYHMTFESQNTLRQELSGNILVYRR